MHSRPRPEDLAATLLNASPDGLLLVDQDGVIELANARAESMFGYQESELIGQPVDVLVPEEQRAGHPALRERYAQNARPRPMGTELRLMAQASDGSLFPVEISLSPVVLGDDVCTIATIRDITERQRTMARVALLQDRERIARDIHDMVIQRLFAAGMSLQSVTSMVHSSVVRQRIESVTDDLDDTIAQLRQSIFRLGQANEGRLLSLAVPAVLDERSRQLGFDPDLAVVGDLDDLPTAIGDQLVATLMEALSNVARHSGADESSVVIVRSASEVSLTVRDNGVGVSATPKLHGGLSNMTWRATELGGSCSVAPITPRGTVLTWNVPILSDDR